MTPEEIATEALGVVGTYTDDYPTTRSTMYRRISARQAELFSLASAADPEYYGVEEVLMLDAGEIDLRDMAAAGTIAPVDKLNHVRVAGAGTSTLTPGRKINVVTTGEEDSQLPPRVTFRNGVIRGYQDDLDGVASLTVAYSRKPLPIDSSGVGDVELPEPFVDLLVWDLARDLVRRSISIEGGAKAAVMTLVTEQENQLMESFMAHIKSSAFVRQQRFFQARIFD